MKRLKISLKAARVNAGLSQDAVAKVLKKSNKTVQLWETGRTEIDRANFEMLCHLYKVSIDDIILPKRFTLSETQEAAN